METSMANDRELQAAVQPEPNDQATPPGAFFIDLDLLDDNPYQPRAERDELKSAQLRESIAREGQLQPILVRRTGARWQIVFGHGRVEALRRLRNEAKTEADRSRFSKVRAEERSNVSDEQMLLLGLVENTQREDISPVDCASALIRLKSLRPDLQTIRQIAGEVQMERPRVKRLLRLHAAPQFIKDAVSKGRSVIIKGANDDSGSESETADQPDTSPAQASPVKTREIRRLDLCSALELARLHTYWSKHPSNEKADGTPDERVTRLIDRALQQDWGFRRVQTIVAKLSQDGIASDADDTPTSKNGKEDLPFKASPNKVVIFPRRLEQMTAAQRAELKNVLEPIWNRLADQPQTRPPREPSLWRWYAGMRKSRRLWGQFIHGCRELLRVLQDEAAKQEAAKSLPPNHHSAGQLPSGVTHPPPHAGQLPAADPSPSGSPGPRSMPIDSSSNGKAVLARPSAPEPGAKTSAGNDSEHSVSQ